MLKILEQMAQGERKMKEGKPLKESRALLVSRSHNFACNVIEYDSERWDNLTGNCMGAVGEVLQMFSRLGLVHGRWAPAGPASGPRSGVDGLVCLGCRNSP